ncbi:hypothetical protein [Aliamphritea hakodatensis]|uniref:hypothetical protein n=1 Tax=Aliamphritea hakodatensis TaxID=2895352 RepID=UPI0022FD3A02|nr:hypothetical protein [Aliamphritea hakodatensis]
MQPRHLRSIAQLVFVLSVAAILAGLFRSTPPQELFPHSDKVGHVAGFLLVALSGYYALPANLTKAFTAVLILLAIGSEYAQASFLPARYFSLQDMFANLSGILIAGIIIRMHNSSNAKKHQ